MKLPTGDYVSLNFNFWNTTDLITFQQSNTYLFWDATFNEDASSFTVDALVTMTTGKPNYLLIFTCPYDHAKAISLL
jgi:hypothetical protein